MPNYARLLSSVSSQLKMAASNSMNVDLTGSQPSELVEGASTQLTRDALSQLSSPKASDLARSWVVSSNKKKMSVVFPMWHRQSFQHPHTQALLTALECPVWP